MRSIGIVTAGILCAWAATASAGPRMDGQLALSEIPLVEVHHKPGHKGGPPWTRRNQSRQEWLERRSYSERRRDCRTTYRTYIDDYTGEYIRRSVRVCD